MSVLEKFSSFLNRGATNNETQVNNNNNENNIIISSQQEGDDEEDDDESMNMSHLSNVTTSVDKTNPSFSLVTNLDLETQECSRQQEGVNQQQGVSPVMRPIIVDNKPKISSPLLTPLSNHQGLEVYTQEIRPTNQEEANNSIKKSTVSPLMMRPVVESKPAVSPLLMNLKPRKQDSAAEDYQREENKGESTMIAEPVVIAAAVETVSPHQEEEEEASSSIVSKPENVSSPPSTNLFSSSSVKHTRDNEEGVRENPATKEESTMIAVPVVVATVAETAPRPLPPPLPPRVSEVDLSKFKPVVLPGKGYRAYPKPVIDRFSNYLHATTITDKQDIPEKNQRRQSIHLPISPFFAVNKKSAQYDISLKTNLDSSCDSPKPAVVLERFTKHLNVVTTRKKQETQQAGGSRDFVCEGEEERSEGVWQRGERFVPPSVPVIPAVRDRDASAAEMFEIELGELGNRSEGVSLGNTAPGGKEGRSRALTSPRVLLTSQLDRLSSSASNTSDKIRSLSGAVVYDVNVTGDKIKNISETVASDVEDNRFYLAMISFVDSQTSLSLRFMKTTQPGYACLLGSLFFGAASLIFWIYLIVNLANCTAENGCLSCGVHVENNIAKECTQMCGRYSFESCSLPEAYVTRSVAAITYLYSFDGTPDPNRFEMAGLELKCEKDHFDYKFKNAEQDAANFWIGWALEQNRLYYDNKLGSLVYVSEKDRKEGKDSNPQAFFDIYKDFSKCFYKDWTSISGKIDCVEGWYLSPYAIWDRYNNTDVEKKRTLSYRCTKYIAHMPVIEYTDSYTYYCCESKSFLALLSESYSLMLLGLGLFSTFVVLLLPKRILKNPDNFDR